MVGPGVWAPDSSSVVFVAQNDTGRYRPPQIYVASADGESRRLVQGRDQPGMVTAGTGSHRAGTNLEDRYYLMLVRPDGAG